MRGRQCPNAVKNIRWYHLVKRWGIWVTAPTHVDTFWFELDNTDKTSKFYNGDCIALLEGMTDAERIKCMAPHITNAAGVTELVSNALLNGTFRFVTDVYDVIR